MSEQEGVASSERGVARELRIGAAGAREQGGEGESWTTARGNTARSEVGFCIEAGLGAPGSAAGTLRARESL